MMSTEDFSVFPFSLEEMQKLEYLRLSGNEANEVLSKLWNTCCPTCEGYSSVWSIGNTGWFFAHHVISDWNPKWDDESSRDWCGGGVIVCLENGELRYAKMPDIADWKTLEKIEAWLDTNLIHQGVPEQE